MADSADANRRSRKLRQLRSKLAAIQSAVTSTTLSAVHLSNTCANSVALSLEKAGSGIAQNRSRLVHYGRKFRDRHRLYTSGTVDGQMRGNMYERPTSRSNVGGASAYGVPNTRAYTGDALAGSTVSKYLTSLEDYVRETLDRLYANLERRLLEDDENCLSLAPEVESANNDEFGNINGGNQCGSGEYKPRTRDRDPQRVPSLLELSAFAYAKIAPVYKESEVCLDDDEWYEEIPWHRRDIVLMQHIIEICKALVPIPSAFENLVKRARIQIASPWTGLFRPTH
ncbi:hypothetical protein HK405_000121 [Cladochytrium tenue]|nr:hypothetical protein HK405_000121 [Cladochytrium tenue]